MTEVDDDVVDLGGVDSELAVFEGDGDLPVGGGDAALAEVGGEVTFGGLDGFAGGRCWW